METPIKLCRNCEIEFSPESEEVFCGLVCEKEYLDKDDVLWSLPCGACGREVGVLYEIDQKMLCKDCALPYEKEGKRLITHLVY